MFKLLIFSTHTHTRKRRKWILRFASQSSKYVLYISMFTFHCDCSLLCYDFTESTPLDEYLKNKNIVLNLDTLIVVAVDLIDAIQCLENRGIVHNNITTSTVLIAEGFRVSNKCLDVFFSQPRKSVSVNCSPDNFFLPCDQ